MKENGVFTCTGINAVTVPKGDPMVNVNFTTTDMRRMIIMVPLASNPYELFKQYSFKHGEEVPNNG